MLPNHLLQPTRPNHPDLMPTILATIPAHNPTLIVEIINIVVEKAGVNLVWCGVVL